MFAIVQRPSVQRIVVACLVLGTAACGFRAPGSSTPLATSLRELVPHGDRDHFVYVVERPTDRGFQPDGFQVEHVSKLTTAGEFEVTLSEDGMATGRVQIRDDGTTIWVLSEEDYTRGVRLAYDPPLPYLQVPLFAGAHRSTSSVKMIQLANGQPAGTMQVTQVVEASAAPPGQWRSGVHGGGVQLRTARTLQSPDGDLELTTTMVLVPGMGEIRSEGQVSGAPALRRQLACAIIGSHAIGDCTNLLQRKK